jgi:protein-disulfide isomerase
MMRGRAVQAGVLATAVVFSLGCGRPKGTETAPQTVATFEGKSISRAELDARLKADRQASAQMFDVENQRHEVLEGVLESMIDQSLFESEAQRRGLTVEKMMAAEVDAKIAPVTEEEKRAQYERIKAQVKDQPEAEILKQIESGMRQDRQAQRRAAFAYELWKKAKASIALDAPRLAVDPGTGPVQGPAKAPVTIVEFSDFQCPYCSRAAATLKQLRQQYGDRVRLFFRHFPLRQIHPHAEKAAEATNCAGRQGHFWEMHDRLFEKQTQLELADLKRYAGELGLNAASFAQCLDSGQEASSVQRDAAAGEALGVRGTPGIFINGRVFKGALPLERFARVIDTELARTGGPASTEKTAGSR